MKRFASLMLLLVFVLSACAMPGAAPAVTETPQPSNTPEPPTNTPTPAATATPEPSPTPDAAATQAAQATESAAGVLAELQKYVKADDNVPYESGKLLWQQDKPLEINLSGPSEEIQSIGEDVTAGNFVFKTDITWEATGLLLCGVVFRSEDDLQEGKQYQFKYLRLSGLPAWAIEVHEFGRFQNTPSDVRTSGALDLKNGATNTLIIVAQDDNFIVIINRTREGKYFDYSVQRSEGAFGFLGFQDSGKGSCLFDNSWVWSLD